MTFLAHTLVMRAAWSYREAAPLFMSFAHHQLVPCQRTLDQGAAYSRDDLRLLFPLIADDA